MILLYDSPVKKFAIHFVPPGKHVRDRCLLAEMLFNIVTPGNHVRERCLLTELLIDFVMGLYSPGMRKKYQNIYAASSSGFPLEKRNF